MYYGALAGVEQSKQAAAAGGPWPTQQPDLAFWLDPETHSTLDVNQITSFVEGSSNSFTFTQTNSANKLDMIDNAFGTAKGMKAGNSGSDHMDGPNGILNGAFGHSTDPGMTWFIRTKVRSGLFPGNQDYIGLTTRLYSSSSNRGCGFFYQSDEFFRFMWFSSALSTINPSALHPTNGSGKLLSGDDITAVAQVYQLGSNVVVRVKIKDGAWSTSTFADTLSISNDQLSRFMIRVDDNAATNGDDWTIGGQSVFFKKMSDSEITEGLDYYAGIGS